MKKLKKIAVIIVSMMMVFLFFVALQSLLAWTGPPGDPPGSPGYLPSEDYSVKLNTGSVAQQKTGLLTLTASNLGLIVNPGKLGVGTALPGSTLGIGDANTYLDTSAGGSLRFTDIQIGARTLSELIDNSANFISGGNTAGSDRSLGNNDTYGLGLETSGATAIFIESGGNLRIGTTTNDQRLVVGGGLRVGWTGATCTAGIAGTMRWNATTTVMEYCNGTVWD